MDKDLEESITQTLKAAEAQEAEKARVREEAGEDPPERAELDALPQAPYGASWAVRARGFDLITQAFMRLSEDMKVLKQLDEEAKAEAEHEALPTRYERVGDASEVDDAKELPTDAEGASVSSEAPRAGGHHRGEGGR
jgi:hypothetical protein